MVTRDWRLPEHRREAFQRFYSFHLKYRTHPGCVYFLLPHLAQRMYGGHPTVQQLAWIVWLNGNTQNPVTTQLILEAAPNPEDYWDAIEFVDENFTRLEWDTDRRHQKSKFGVATAQWAEAHGRGYAAAEGWLDAAADGWAGVWKHALSQPYMGRLSAWSMSEYAKILLPGMPDSSTLLLHDKTGSQSHRNGLALIAGFDSVYWPPEAADLMGLVPRLEALGESLLQEARERNPGHPDVGYLTLESALCTYKSWHKPNRRYPNVYADMHHNRIVRAEERFGDRFELQWEARAEALPSHLRLECNPNDPGLSPAKQNHYRETGEPIMLTEFGIPNTFETMVAEGHFGTRKGK